MGCSEPHLVSHRASHLFPSFPDLQRTEEALCPSGHCDQWAGRGLPNWWWNGMGHRSQGAPRHPFEQIGTKEGTVLLGMGGNQVPDTSKTQLLHQGGVHPGVNLRGPFEGVLMVSEESPVQPCSQATLSSNTTSSWDHSPFLHPERWWGRHSFLIYSQDRQPAGNSDVMLPKTPSTLVGLKFKEAARIKK